MFIIVLKDQLSVAAYAFQFNERLLWRRAHGRLLHTISHWDLEAGFLTPTLPNPFLVYS